MSLPEFYVRDERGAIHLLSAQVSTLLAILLEKGITTEKEVSARLEEIIKLQSESMKNIAESN